LLLGGWAQSEPLVYVPMVDVQKLAEPGIIHSF
jgi:hypothetical protein